MLETNNINEAVCNIVWGRRGRVTIDEKDAFIQKQSTVVSSKTLVLLKCLNTFVHDCSSQFLAILLCRELTGMLEQIKLYNSRDKVSFFHRKPVHFSSDFI